MPRRPLPSSWRARERGRRASRLRAAWRAATDPTPGVAPESGDAQAAAVALAALAVRRARAVVWTVLVYLLVASVEYAEPVREEGWRAARTGLYGFVLGWRAVCVPALVAWLVWDARLRRRPAAVRRAAAHRQGVGAVWLLLLVGATYAPAMLWDSGLAVMLGIAYTVVAVTIHPPGRGAPLAFLGSAVVGVAAWLAADGLGAPTADNTLQPWTLIPATSLFAYLMWRMIYVGLFRARVGRRALRRSQLALVRNRQALAAAERAAGEAAERERLARDLHDSVGAGLATVVAGLETARYEGNGSAAVGALAPVEQAARDTLVHLREAVWALTPGAMTRARLAAHVERIVRLRAAAAGLALTVEASGADGPLAPEAALALARIAQEAVSNAAAHSGGTRVAVRLAADARGGAVLTVADDGRFRPDGGAGHGLASMRARAEALGGTLAVAGTDAGTTVTATLPP